MTEPQDAHRQIAHSLRMDWGPTGAAAIGTDCDVAVVVDVLSFTTTLTVAADRGIVVFPYPAQLDSSRAVPRLVEAAFTPELRPV